MTDTIDFNGKVVLVTGAGSGLGRAHALAFGSRGARVVVNDLGGDVSGEGSGSTAADSVVEEIIQRGGKAISDHNSVEYGEKIIDDIIRRLGRIDIVVNNAGILRDKSFAKMSEADWDLVYRVHLLGTYSVSRAAWPHMLEQNGGCIINTSSASGMYGNFGQANYSAAKLGIYGLTRTLAVEGAGKGIRSIAIAPVALSRMTESILPEELSASLDPAHVSELVVRLASSECEENGSLFEVGAGCVSKIRFERSKGIALPINKDISAEMFGSHWDDVCDFSTSDNPNTVEDAFIPILKNIEATKNIADKQD